MIVDITFKELEKRLDIEFNEIYEVENRKREQAKTITPNDTQQTIAADAGKLLSKVIVEPIPSQYVIPQGTLIITDTELKDVREYESAQVVVNNLEAENIKEGVTILGVEGAFTDTMASHLNGTLTDYSSSVVTSVGQYAFYYNKGIVNLDLPNCESVGRTALSYCDNLQNVNLPNCESIGDSAFSYSKKLETINISNVKTLGASTFNNCIALKSIDLPYIETISNQFYSCNELTEINLPNLVTITGGAFNYCKKLNSLILPKLETINYTSSIISTCNKLKKFYAPQLTAIPKNTLCDAGLETANISMCESIGEYAFNRDGYLKAVIIRQKNSICTLANSNAFQMCYHILGTTNTTYNPNGDKDGYIYVPDELVEDYKTATNWSVYADQIRPVSEYVEE